MPTNPVNESITLNVVTTLEGVTTGNGYQVTLDVKRHARKAWTPAHLMAIVHEGDDQELGDDETPMGYKAWRREYAIQIYVLQAGLPADANLHTWMNIARADAEKAIMADFTRGGYARNCEIRAPQEFVDANDLTGVIVFFDVTYRTNELDPYQPAP